MRNHILYTAFTPEEILGCSYSLLKYLGLYNLKPPAEHAVVVYTNDPAALEAYGSFFNRFQLKDLLQLNEEAEAQRSPAERLTRQYAAEEEGNLLYMAHNTYPVSTLDPLFRRMEQGHVVGMANHQALGWNTHAEREAEVLIKNGVTENSEGTIAVYENFPEFYSLLRQFFKKNYEESIPNLVKRAHAIDAKQIEAEKKKFLELPRLSRWIKTITGRGWSINNHIARL